MVRILIILLLLVQGLYSNAQSVDSINDADSIGIKFEDGLSWQQVLQKARSVNRLLYHLV
jgi:hypothetical protein